MDPNNVYLFQGYCMGAPLARYLCQTWDSLHMFFTDKSLPNDNKISANKIREISKFDCHGISQEKTAFWDNFRKFFTLPNPSMHTLSFPRQYKIVMRKKKLKTPNITINKCPHQLPDPGSQATKLVHMNSLPKQTNMTKNHERHCSHVTPQQKQHW